MALNKETQQFDDISDNELDLLREGLSNKNTKKANSKCGNLLQSYLWAKGKSTEYWLYDEPDLDRILGKFWFEVRTKKGEGTLSAVWDI